MNQSVDAMMQEGYAAAERIIADFLAEYEADYEEAIGAATDAIKTAATVPSGFNTFLLERIILLAALAVKQS